MAGNLNNMNAYGFMDDSSSVIPPSLAVSSSSGVQGDGTVSNPVRLNADTLSSGTVAGTDNFVTSSSGNLDGQLTPVNTVPSFVLRGDTGSDTVNLTENVDILGDTNTKIKTEITGANELTISLDTTGATLGQIPAVNVSGGISFVTPSSGITNLSTGNITTTTLDVISDTGTDATLPSATVTTAGLMSAQDKVDMASLLSNQHVPATVTDGQSIDLTITGQDITAELVGLASASLGQVPTKNGTGGISWATPQSNLAINGTSVDGSGNVVLGQDVGQAGNPAQLTSNREIPMNGQNLSFTHPGYAPQGSVSYIQADGTIIAANQLVARGDNTSDRGGQAKIIAGFYGAENNVDAILEMRTKATTTSANPNRTFGHILYTETEGGSVFGTPAGTSIYANYSYPSNSAGTTIAFDEDNSVIWTNLDTLPEKRIVLGFSAQGKYYLGNTITNIKISGTPGGLTPSSLSLPITSSASTLENLAIDTSNGQIVRKQGLASEMLVARQTANQTVVNGAFTKLTNWTTDVDTLSGFNATTGVYTIPTTGVYVMLGTITWDGAPNAPISVGKVIRGIFGTDTLSTVYDYQTSYMEPTAGGFTVAYMSFNTVASLTAGQTVSMWTLYDGGTANIQTRSSVLNSRFTLYKIK